MAWSVLQATKIVDRVTAYSVAKIGTSGSGYGVGDNTLVGTSKYGADRAAYDLVNDILAMGDFTVENALFTTANNLSAGAAYQPQLKSDLFQFITAVNQQCQNAGISGVSDLDGYALTNNNGTTAWNSLLLPPDWPNLWSAVMGKTASILNIYSPAIANMGSFAVTGAGTGNFSAGTNVDTTKYAGAAVSRLVVSSATTGTGLITVTGKNQNGVGSRTWTVTTTQTTGTYDLTPTATGDILTQVTGIACANAITAGTVQVAGDVPYTTLMATQVVGGSFTVGTRVPWGSDNPVCIITGSTAAGTGITVTGVNQNGLGGRTWTVTPSSPYIGRYALTATISGDLLTSVTSVGGGPTSATILVYAQRQSPPVA